MKEVFDKGKALFGSVAEKVTAEVGERVSMFSETVNGLPIFVSKEASSTYEVEYDEKHYFVIPYKLAETGFSLHTLRCLPPSVTELNDLPKRRIFHLPNEHYESSLRNYLLRSAQELAVFNRGEEISTIKELADNIDALDNKITYGMLLVGGIAAFFNPLVGAGKAIKALTPGASSLLNKYGLKPLGEKLSKRQMEQAVKQAENHVLQQFASSSTLKVVNPILQELELALRTTEKEHDPLTDFSLADGIIPALDNERWRELIETAVYHVYEEVLHDPSQYDKAGLGQEDIRWFKTCSKILVTNRFVLRTYRYFNVPDFPKFLD